MEDSVEEGTVYDSEIKETPFAVSKVDMILKVIMGGLGVPIIILLCLWHWLVLIDSFTVVSPYWFAGVPFVFFLGFTILTAASYADSEFYIFRRREKREAFIFRHSNDRHFTPCLTAIAAMVTAIDALSWLIWSASGETPPTNAGLENSTTYKEHVYLALNVFSTLLYLGVLISFIIRTSVNASLRSLYFRDETLAGAFSTNMKNSLKRISK